MAYKFAPYTPAGPVSWDDLTDKPFGGQGVTIVSEPEIARSDAEFVRIAYNNRTMTGLYDVIGLYVKISDRVFTKEELATATLTHADSQTEELSADKILGDDKAAYVLTEDAERILLISSSKLSLALEEFYDENVEGQGPVELPSRGTYVLATTTSDWENALFYPEIIGITVPTACQTLDEKYIPNTIATTKELDEVSLKAKDFATQAKMEAESDVAAVLGGYVPTASFNEHTHSWNDLEDKPFGMSEDGVVDCSNTTDAATFTCYNSDSTVAKTYVKISDGFLTRDTLVNATIVMADGSEGTIDEYGVRETYDSNYVNGVSTRWDACVAFLYDDEYGDYNVFPIVVSTEDFSALTVSYNIGVTYGDTVIPSPGTYVICNTDTGAPEVTAIIPKSCYTTINEHFVPDSIARVAAVKEVDEKIMALDNRIGFNNPNPNVTMAQIIEEKFAVPTSIDLTALETEGKIVETFADDSTKTTTVEFDADGNPVKMTDEDGNETVLTW